MYYAGIDIAKLNHFASVVSADGEVLIKPFKFTNDNYGFCKLLSVLASYERGSLIIAKVMMEISICTIESILNYFCIKYSLQRFVPDSFNIK